MADETYDISLMSSTTHWLSSRHIGCRQFLTRLHGAAAARQRTQAQSSWSEAGEMSASSTRMFLHDSAVLQFTAQRGQTAQACTEPFFQSSGDEGSAWTVYSCMHGLAPALVGPGPSSIFCILRAICSSLTAVLAIVRKASGRSRLCETQSY